MTAKLQSHFLSSIFCYRSQHPVPLSYQLLMPGPCIQWLKFVNNFGNRFYEKEKSTGWSLLFQIESVTKLVNKLKRTRLCGRKDSNLISNFRLQNESDSLSFVVGLYSNGCSKQGSKYVYFFLNHCFTLMHLRDYQVEYNHEIINTIHFDPNH